MDVKIDSLKERIAIIEAKVDGLGSKSIETEINLYGKDGHGGQLKSLQTSIDHLAAVVSGIKPQLFSDKQIIIICSTIITVVIGVESAIKLIPALAGM